MRDAEHGFDDLPGWRLDTAVLGLAYAAALVAGLVLRWLWHDPDLRYVAFVLAAVCLGAVPLVWK